MVPLNPTVDTPLGEYELIRTLGEGAFGKVKLARHILTGTEVAFKVIKKALLVRSVSLAREVCNMQRLSHPHIVRLYQVLDTEEEIILMMEYCENGDLGEYLRERGRLPETEAREIFAQILAAVNHCHINGVAHRDLKPENVLMGQNGSVKLADFGFSIQCSDTKLATCCGSPYYAAPELFLLQSYNGPRADVWSLGVVLYVMVTGSLPFQGNDVWAVRGRVLSGCFTVPTYLTPMCVDLLRTMLTRDPESRGTAEELMAHPWVKRKCELPDSPLLHQDPTDRQSITVTRTVGSDQVTGQDSTSSSECSQRDIGEPLFMKFLRARAREDALYLKTSVSTETPLDSRQADSQEDTSELGSKSTTSCPALEQTDPECTTTLHSPAAQSKLDSTSTPASKHSEAKDSGRNSVCPPDPLPCSPRKRRSHLVQRILALLGNCCCLPVTRKSNKIHPK